jgi:transaldolase
MILFADTGNIKELEELQEMGVIRGVTTNPTLLSQQGQDVIKSLQKICDLLPDYPVCAQVTASDTVTMVEQGKKINSAGKLMVVKVPATNNGLKAISALNRQGIKTCATAVLTSAEALMCAEAGADYVAPYTGQNNLIGFEGLRTLREIAEIFRIGGSFAKILAASIDTPQDIVDIAAAGAHIATLTYNQIVAVCDNAKPLTDVYIDRFLSDWNSAGAFFK